MHDARRSHWSNVGFDTYHHGQHTSANLETCVVCCALVYPIGTTRFNEWITYPSCTAMYNTHNGKKTSSSWSYDRECLLCDRVPACTTPLFIQMGAVGTHAPFVGLRWWTKLNDSSNQIGSIVKIHHSKCRGVNVKTKSRVVFVPSRGRIVMYIRVSGANSQALNYRY